MGQQKKRVLMFCVSFFGYEKRLAEAIRNFGYDVELYNERPNNGFISKACIRYNVLLYRPIIRQYYKQIIQETRDKTYDYIFVVKGEVINEEIFGLLKEAHSNAKFVLYLWDSVANIPDCENRMKLYDRILTFDPKDAKRYNIPYLSVPYDENSFAYTSKKEYAYDVAFIGTAHSVRPRVVTQFAEQCRSVGRNCFTYFYSPHILVYLFNKLTNPDYRWISLKDIHFKPLSSDQVAKIYSCSKCVLDIEHPRQSGTTTRPVEMLPMQKKIITTNYHAKDFPFYNNNNFCIIDRNEPKLDELFLDTEYLPVDEKFLKEYSPENFVRILLEL